MAQHSFLIRLGSSFKFLFLKKSQGKIFNENLTVKSTRLCDTVSFELIRPPCARTFLRRPQRSEALAGRGATGQGRVASRRGSVVRPPSPGARDVNTTPVIVLIITDSEGARDRRLAGDARDTGDATSGRVGRGRERRVISRPGGHFVVVFTRLTGASPETVPYARVARNRCGPPRPATQHNITNAFSEVVSLSFFICFLFILYYIIKILILFFIRFARRVFCFIFHSVDASAGRRTRRVGTYSNTPYL